MIQHTRSLGLSIESDPVGLFLDLIERDGERFQRFEFLGASENELE